MANTLKPHRYSACKLQPGCINPLRLPSDIFLMTLRWSLWLLILHLLIYQSTAPHTNSRRKNWKTVVRQQRHRKEAKVNQVIDVLHDKGTDGIEAQENYYSLGWAKWSEWSSCSKSCSNEGVQYQLRRCLDTYCSGPPARHRLCRTEDCPQNSSQCKVMQKSNVHCEQALYGALPERWTHLS
uniref:Uncharacterized protein n=1 Tax=Ditylenchus dipsaci TaxID=166011 RepID=A0A915E5U8_9BILA